MRPLTGTAVLVAASASASGRLLAVDRGGQVERVTVFVVDGHDIDTYPDAESAAREIEGYDAHTFDYIGADGAVYEATVDGTEWGPVMLSRTDANRFDELVRLLREEAEYRGLALPPSNPDDAEAIWGALLAAQQNLTAAGKRAHTNRRDGA